MYISQYILLGVASSTADAQKAVLTYSAALEVLLAVMRRA
jgi:hypothetical protein